MRYQRWLQLLVYINGGIRKVPSLLNPSCMVLGARAGKGGLAYDGQTTVEQVLRILKNELTAAMQITGEDYSEVKFRLVYDDVCKSKLHDVF